MAEEITQLWGRREDGNGKAGKLRRQQRRTCRERTMELPRARKTQSHSPSLAARQASLISSRNFQMLPGCSGSPARRGFSSGESESVRNDRRARIVGSSFPEAWHGSFSVSTGDLRSNAECNGKLPLLSELIHCHSNLMHREQPRQLTKDTKTRQNRRNVMDDGNFYSCSRATLSCLRQCSVAENSVARDDG